MLKIYKKNSEKKIAILTETNQFRKWTLKENRGLFHFVKRKNRLKIFSFRSK